MNRFLRIILVAAVLLAPQLCFAQYVGRLYDFDSTTDFGSNIRIRPDGSLLVFGSAINSFFWPGLSWLILSPDNHQVIEKKVTRIPEQGFYIGRFGRLLDLGSDLYVHPSTIGYPPSGKPFIPYAACLLKINGRGDTVFARSYTDTALFTETLHDIARTKDGFILGGSHQSFASGSVIDGLLIRTDSLGNMIYRRTYRKANFPGTHTGINSVEALDDGRLLITAGVFSFVHVNHQFDYYRKTPWIFITDSAGNIVRERFLPFKYGGNLSFPAVHKDRNGGYFLYGCLDSFVVQSPLAFTNFPHYIAHLDTNFNVTWIKHFADTITHSYLINVEQLRDSAYLLIGTKDGGAYNSAGWVAKVDPKGALLWETTARTDTLLDSGFYDAVEMPDKSIVISGAAKQDTAAPWRQQDVWIVRLDSNGCHTDCYQEPPASAKDFFSIYPNPTGGAIRVRTGQPGMLHIFSLQGQLIAAYKVDKDHFSFDLPPLAAGIYPARFLGEETKQVTVVKISYQP